MTFLVGYHLEWASRPDRPMSGGGRGSPCCHCVRCAGTDPWWWYQPPFDLVTGDRCGVITSHITGIIAHSDGHHTCIGVKYLVIYVCLLNKYTVYIVSLATINTHLTKVHSSFTSFRAVEQPLLTCTIFANNNKKSWFNYCQAQAQFSFLSTLFNNASPP